MHDPLRADYSWDTRHNSETSKDAHAVHVLGNRLNKVMRDCVDKTVCNSLLSFVCLLLCLFVVSFCCVFCCVFLLCPLCIYSCVLHLCFERYPELEIMANENYGGVPAMAKKWAKVVRKRANNERAIQVRFFGC